MHFGGGGASTWSSAANLDGKPYITTYLIIKNCPRQYPKPPADHTSRFLTNPIFEQNTLLMAIDKYCGISVLQTQHKRKKN